MRFPFINGINVVQTKNKIQKHTDTDKQGTSV